MYNGDGYCFSSLLGAEDDDIERWDHDVLFDEGPDYRDHAKKI